MSVENGQLKILSDVDALPASRKSEPSLFRVVTPIKTAPDDITPLEFDPPKRWPMRSVVFFVLVSSAALWSLIIWGAMSMFR